MTIAQLRNDSNVGWLIGTGLISVDYISVLKEFDVEVIVIGRGEASASEFEKKTGVTVEKGGLSLFLESNPILPGFAIVCVQEHGLASIGLELMAYGVSNILLEKPGALNIPDISKLIKVSSVTQTRILLGYNRRFYQSVMGCQDLLSGSYKGTHVHFEFTEWLHTINFDRYNDEELSKWFLCNSSHVVDLFFFLFGKPTHLHSRVLGGLDWHPSGTIFSGSGETERGVVFTYHAHWGSVGRWGMDISVSDQKMIFRPLERLALQKKGCLDVVEKELDYSMDVRFKPGLFFQVKAFLEGDDDRFCTLNDQLDHFKWFYKMANYSDS